MLTYKKVQKQNETCMVDTRESTIQSGSLHF